ncbi:MAG: DUF1349 domain-containing protein [Calditrichaceae bacterium]|nr:DUF1349 domain-containing protein [Calditrichaceae bacterium]MBN2708146.1 DUF1349 domain-containing protein [Calditrichaceae bacterium]
MKRFFSFIILQLFISISLPAQNLLSTGWKICFIDTSEINISQIESSNWKDVYLSLSWERQSYSWLDGKGSIENEFTLPAELTGLKFITKNTFGLYYSEDGKDWFGIRGFRLNKTDSLRIGFSAQSPTGDECSVEFLDIDLQEREPNDPWKGDKQSHWVYYKN